MFVYDQELAVGLLAEHVGAADRQSLNAPCGGPLSAFGVNANWRTSCALIDGRKTQQVPNNQIPKGI